MTLLINTNDTVCNLNKEPMFVHPRIQIDIFFGHIHQVHQGYGNNQA